MTVLVAPEMWMAQGPATDVEANKLRTSAAAFRRTLDASLSFRQGVVYTRGTCQDLKVNATGTPDGFVHVVAGACFVRGTQAATQGMYHLYNDATLDINVLGPNPAHATLDRIDLAVARYQDQFYSGSLDLPTIEMVTGTPSGSPAVPAAPANSLILAQLSIVHATSTIPQTVITDRRAPAGAQPVLLDEILVGTDSRYPAATALITFLNSTGGTTNLIPPGFRNLGIEWYMRGDSSAVTAELRARLNNVSTATYDSQNLNGAASAVAAAEALAATGISLGVIPAATAIAGYFGQGDAKLAMYAGAVGNKLLTSRYGYMSADTTGTQQEGIWGGKTRVVGTPVTRLDLFLAPGNIINGSHAALWGLVPYQP